MRNRLAVVVTAAAAVVGSVLAAPVASAAPPGVRCLTGYVCIFANAQYGGDRRDVYMGVGDVDNFKTELNFNDTASSIINNSGKTVTLYRDYDQNGSRYTSRPGAYDPTFADNGFDNVASSLRIA